MEDLEGLISDLTAKRETEKEYKSLLESTKEKKVETCSKIIRILMEKPILTENEFIFGLIVDRISKGEVYEKIKTMQEVSLIYERIGNSYLMIYLHTKEIIEKLKEYKGKQQRFTITDRGDEPTGSYDMRSSYNSTIAAYEGLLLNEFSLAYKTIKLDIQPPFLKNGKIINENKIRLSSGERTHTFFTNIKLSEYKNSPLETKLRNMKYGAETKRIEKDQVINYEVPKDAGKRFDEIIEKMKRGD